LEPGVRYMDAAGIAAIVAMLDHQAQLSVPRDDIN
jgi:hypothetical protein